MQQSAMELKPNALPPCHLPLSLVLASGQEEVGREDSSSQGEVYSVSTVEAGTGLQTTGQE